MKTLYIGKPAEITKGVYTGFCGIIVAYDSTQGDVLIRLDDYTNINVSSQFVEQTIDSINQNTVQLTFPLNNHPVPVQQVIDIGIRWEQGMPHDARSIEMFNFLKDYDFYLTDDFFGFKSGGDGDNGEHLMYLMDEYFANKDVMYHA